MFTTQMQPQATARIERRKFQRDVSNRSYDPRLGAQREFGIGYGRSSGYAHVRSYVGSQPGYFRCS